MFFFNISYISPKKYELQHYGRILKIILVDSFPLDLAILYSKYAHSSISLVKILLKLIIIKKN